MMININARCPLCRLLLEEVRPLVFECPRHPVKQSDAKQIAERALDAIGPGVRCVVLIQSPKDRYTVELGAQGLDERQTEQLITAAWLKVRDAL